MWPELFVCRNGRFLSTILLCLLLIGSLTACQNEPGYDPIGTLVAPRPTPDAAATAWAAATRIAQPTLSPEYAPGESRTIPLPAGSLISLENWDVQVLDMKRGEEAWQLIRQANRFNEPAAPGYEYLLVQFWVKNKSRDKGSLFLEVTGERNNLYKYYQTGVVRPDPSLSTYLEANEESLGWLAYAVHERESNLILRVEDGIDFRATAVYAALSEGAAQQRPAALDAIVPTAWGQTADDPLILGQIATTDSWQVQVKEVILGEAAYEKILAANRFNDPPPPGMQYGLARIWLRYIGPGESPVYISTARLELWDSTETAYKLPRLVTPDPQLQGDLYPGGEKEGWLAFQIPAAEIAPILRWEISRDELRYLSLAASGR